jgi:hypothetical protein
MESLMMSFVTPLSNPGDSDNPGNPGRVCIIVPRVRAYLADLLAKAFERREDVEIIVDRRYGERRTRKVAVTVERRWTERRRSKEEVIEVVIGKTTESESSRGGSD